MKNYLNFENDVKKLELEMEKLKDPYNQDGLTEVDTKKISESQQEIDKKLLQLLFVQTSKSWPLLVLRTTNCTYGKRQFLV